MRWPLVAGALLGAAFFAWIAGVRLITPTEVAWSMQLDWHWHFLGWHFFRHEPWHLPPGRIVSYVEPLGTAVGFTDSIPIVALALKPLSSRLPQAFQYLGAWMLICFALQGFFGVLLMRLWTPRVPQQLLGAACFIVVPTLLSRAGHPALCAHWLLLWALWLYLREADRALVPIGQSAALGLVAGLVHPYLAAMVLGLLTALTVRLLIARRVTAIAMLALAISGVLTGWWLSGLFTITDAANLAAGGLSQFSMNLLAPITPSGWSTILPDQPVANDGQVWEGFQYLGAGLLLLVWVAMLVAAIHYAPPDVLWFRTPTVFPRKAFGMTLWPLAIVATLFALYALGPHISLGGTVLARFDHPLLDRLAFFRATGRFFWPTTYVIVAAALAAVVLRLSPRVATVVLCAVLVVQFVDLRDAYAFRRRVSRHPGFHAWQPSLASPAWPRLLPLYEHVVLYPPSYCGGQPPVDLASIGYLAGLHGLSLNSGLVARLDEPRRRAACREIADTLARGEVDDSRLYIGRPGEIEPIMKRAPLQPMVCGTIDSVGVCVTARSYEAWRDVAHLE